MPTIPLSTSANMIRPNFYTVVGAYILLVILLTAAVLYYAELKAKRKPTRAQKRPERSINTERPIEITKLIDKYAEDGRLPLSFGGKYLSKEHAGTGAIKLDLRAIGPDVEKNKTKKEEKDQRSE